MDFLTKFLFHAEDANVTTSPQDQGNARFSGVTKSPSLIRIPVSKSRQATLQLCLTAKSVSNFTCYEGKRSQKSYFNVGLGGPSSDVVWEPEALFQLAVPFSVDAPGVAAWCPHMPVPVAYQGVSPAIGIGCSPTFVSGFTDDSAELVSSATSTAFGCSPKLSNLVVSGSVDLVSNNLVAVTLVYYQNLSNNVSSNSADQAVNDPGAGLVYSLNVGNCVSGNGVDQASEGRDDYVSGKKVKFLCSFGGKILPRPGDGVLRFVGGYTRIISIRRDVSFSELVQKMVDTYGQAVFIKYQLPDEDLETLVSVSCTDDFDNMMEEYEKLVARSSDESAKLRMFLFAASGLDPSGMVQFGDLHDSGQRYIDAINGIGDGGGIARKDSIASATSTQNSDFNGSEPVDCATSGPDSATGCSPCGCFQVFKFKSNDKKRKNLQGNCRGKTWLGKKLKESSKVVVGPKWKNLIRRIGGYC